MQAVTIDRDKYVGGSDIPIIMGISPFKTRFELLLEKAGLKENDFNGNDYTEYGNVLEPKIRDYINATYNKNFIEGKHYNEDIRVHTDGEDDNAILEIKTTSQIHENVNDYKVYLVQLLFYMFQTDKLSGMLAVYERPKDFNEEFDKRRLQIFNIKLEDYKDLLEQINKAVEQFRIDLVKIKENPFTTEEELLPVDLIELSNKVVVLENQLAEMEKVETLAKELKAQLKSAMQNNNIKKWETPNGVKITLVEDKPDETIIEKVVNEDLFRSENLELVKQYELKQSEYLEEKEVIKKGRSGYVKITLSKEE